MQQKKNILLPSAKLSWEIDDYVPSMAALLRAGHTEKEIRHEYTRLRDIAQKRLKRIGASEFAGSDTYKFRAEGFPKLGQLKGSQMAAALADVARFVGAKTGSLTGMREQQAKSLTTLHRHGYSGINAGNIKEFGDYMEVFRAKMQAGLFDSKRVYQVYMFGKQHGIRTDYLMDNFEKWYQYSRVLDSVNVGFTDKTDSELMLKEFEEALSEM